MNLETVKKILDDICEVKGFNELYEVRNDYDKVFRLVKNGYKPNYAKSLIDYIYRKYDLEIKYIESFKIIKLKRNNQTIEHTTENDIEKRLLLLCDYLPKIFILRLKNGLSKDLAKEVIDESICSNDLKNAFDIAFDILDISH